MFCNFVYNLDDYTFISHPRLLKMGGGVGMYVDTNFKYTTGLELPTSPLVRTLVKITAN